ncbi:MAG: hypothetical protein LC746_03470 [Acidobacteria bacterium]|nr:hypothetical protein [Acidobacteriota bacterium]
MTRRTSILAVFAALLFTLSLSSAASAQSNDPWWGRDGDQRDRDRYGRNGGYGRYDSRTLRDVAQRIKDRSRDLEGDVRRALNNSRYDGSRREDDVNADVKDFRRAADDFKSRVGGGNDPSRARDEAQRLVAYGDRLDRELSRLRLDSRAYSDLGELRQDLRTVADIYGFGYGGNGGYGYPNGNNNRYPNRNDNWWRRIPDVINGRRP